MKVPRPVTISTLLVESSSTDLFITPWGCSPHDPDAHLACLWKKTRLRFRPKYPRFGQTETEDIFGSLCLAEAQTGANPRPSSKNCKIHGSEFHQFQQWLIMKGSLVFNPKGLTLTVQFRTGPSKLFEFPEIVSRSRIKWWEEILKVR